MRKSFYQAITIPNFHFLAHSEILAIRYFVFYSGTLPLLGAFHAIVDLTLHVLGLLQPTYALIGSLLFLCGWATQVGFWTQCDLTSSLETSGSETCYQMYVEDLGGNGVLPSGLAGAKVAFGWIVVIL